MTVWEVILIGVALSMDAAALTVANETAYKDTPARKTAVMILSFAFGQSLLLAVGYFAGSLISEALVKYSGIITSAVFFILFISILAEALKKEKSVSAAKLTYGVIAVQAVADSIDALAVGVTFSINPFNIFAAFGIVSAVSLAVVLTAHFLGKFLGDSLGKSAKLFGAVILLAMAIKEFIGIFI